MLSNFALADQQQVAGSGQSGFSVSAGYNGAQLNYKEIDPNARGVLDKDTGWQNGATVEGRYDGEVLKVPFFMRANFDYLGSGSTRYNGALQNGTTLIMTTSENIYKTEFNAGFKVWNPMSFTLAPYLGIGYRDWERGKDVLPDYKESYTWWYGVAGANLAYRATGRLLLGLDAALLLPISPEMQTNVAGLYDTATFHIRSRAGYRVQLPASYDVYKDEKYKIFTFLTPYYERWNVGQSPVVTLTRGGNPVATGIEPTSHADLYGVKVGVGINF